MRFGNSHCKKTAQANLMKICRQAGVVVFYVHTEFRLYTGNGGEEGGCKNLFPRGENRGYDFVQSG